MLDSGSFSPPSLPYKFSNMNKVLTFIIAVLFSTRIANAQDNSNSPGDYRNFPILISLQFQNLASPFHDLKGNFSNIGLLVGTEVSFNGKQNWVQQFQTGFFFNKNAGNGLMLLTQTVYRPTVFQHFYPEIKAGIGWQRIYHPVDSYEFQNGNWESIPGGKSQLIVPLGISIGYNDYKEGIYLSPYISYQVIPALNYNDVIPLNFYSLVQVGTRIHFNYDSK